MSRKVSPEPTTTTIPVDEAIERTKNWRDFMASHFTGTDPKQLPKAVFMSVEDIEGLYGICQANKDVVGMRAYFTLNTPDAEDGVQNEIRFVMVAVSQPADAVPTYGGTDMLFLQGGGIKSFHDLGDGDDDSGVYDFTKPCPDCCDPNSPLYGEQPTRQSK